MTSSGPRLVETYGGFSISDGSRHFYSKRDPGLRPSRIARSIPMEGQCLFLVCSPLLGYGIPELLESLPEDSMVLALEIDQELMKLCSPHIQPELLNHPQISWVRTEHPTALIKHIKSLAGWPFRRIRRVALNGAYFNYAKTYDELFVFLEEAIKSHWRNRHVVHRLGRSWIRHSFSNLASLNEALSLDDLRILGPIVVAGAGSSLESSLEILQKYRKEIWILAVDSALSTLLSSGIRPDAVLALETQFWNQWDFHDAVNSNIPIIADLSAYPPSLGVTAGPLYVFRTDFGEEVIARRIRESYPAIPNLPPVGSVGVSAVIIAQRLSDGPILLTGLDFCYDPGKTHARGSASHRNTLSTFNRFNRSTSWNIAHQRKSWPVETLGGSTVRTDAVLYAYAESLKAEFNKRQQTYILWPGGLDLGLQCLKEHKLQEVLKGHRPKSQPSIPIKQLRQTGILLEEERNKLMNSLTIWDRFSSNQASIEDYIQTLDGLDYVWFDFPDTSPIPRQNESLLFRIAARCRRLLSLLDRVISD